MGVCAFVASGVDFDVDAYVQDSPLEVMGVFHEGEVHPDAGPETEPKQDSGFVAYVSQDDSPHLLDQVGDAVDFIAANNSELARLRGEGAEKLLFNFGLATHQIAKRPQYLPPELLLAMGRSRIGLVFAVADIGEG